MILALLMETCQIALAPVLAACNRLKLPSVTFHVCVPVFVYVNVNADPFFFLIKSAFASTRHLVFEGAHQHTLG